MNTFILFIIKSFYSVNRFNQSMQIFRRIRTSLVLTQVFFAFKRTTIRRYLFRYKNQRIFSFFVQYDLYLLTISERIKAKPFWITSQLKWLTLKVFDEYVKL